MTGFPLAENRTAPVLSYANLIGQPNASLGMAVSPIVFVAVKNGNQTVSKSIDQTLRPCGFLVFGISNALM